MSQSIRTTAVRPFRALHFDPRRVRFGDVLSPPYDVIGPEQRERLLARSPYNVVRLILPDPGRESQVHDLICAWRADGVLCRDPEPCFYCVEQEYTDLGGARRARRGLVALVRLEPYEAGVVRPHERTRPEPKAGRLRLLRATRAQLSPVFALYRDPERRVEALGFAARDAQPDIDVVDDEGTRHRLWRVRRDLAAMSDALASSPLLIADGHHRYETALAYQAEMGAADDHPAAWTMMYLTPSDGDGLVVFPTHRVVNGVDAATVAGLPRLLLDAGLRVEVVAGGVGDLDEALAASDEHVAIGLWRGAGVPALIAHTDAPGIGAEIAQERVLGPLLGLPAEEIALTDRVEYVHRADEAAERVAARPGRVALLLSPPSVAEIEEVAARGATMPQKSTYFYPKMLDGLVFYDLDECP